MVGKYALICAMEIQKIHMVVHIFSGFALLQMSINQKSGRQTFRRRFVSGSLFVSSCPPECNFQSETKIEPGLRLGSLKMDCPFQIACVQPPPPSEKIGEGVSVGEGTTVPRPVSDE